MISNRDITMEQSRYNDYNTYLRQLYNCRVQKITIDAGFTCPNRDGTKSNNGCIYCNDKGSGTGAYQKGLSITDQLNIGKQSLARRYKAKKFIAYFQSFSNTYAPLPQIKRAYEEALAVKDIVGLSIGTRPDCVNEKVLDYLSELNQSYPIWIEYGLQSSHDETLNRINRGHDCQTFSRAVYQTKKRKLSVCVHIILGLPGETPHMMLQTADYLNHISIDAIKLHLLYVIKGTQLDFLYQTGKYQCLSQKIYSNLVCSFIARTAKHVIFQRLTGDPHPEELVAPLWALQKKRNLQAIKDMLEQRDIWQGQQL